MNSFYLYIIVAVGAYLLGSIPFGYLLVRIFRGEDIRRSGSGNIGATNVARSGAKGLGIATLVLDAVKGCIAVLLAWYLGRKIGYIGPLSDCFGYKRAALGATAALFAVVGHVFPVWLKFKGGKGVATALGVFVLLFPKAILVSLAIFIVVVAVTRYVSLGSILGALAFPVAAYFMEYPDRTALLLTAAVSLIVVVKHRENIVRLLKGTENRLGASKLPAVEKPL